MVQFALKTPYTILVVALIMLVIGVFSMMKMPLDILPTFRLPAVMVVTTYTGMPAEMMEADITNRLERWLSQASGLDHMESRSMIGVSVLNCFFESGFDPNNALAQISTLVMSDLHYLPPGTQPPIVIGYDPTANLPVALMTIFTPGVDEAKLWDESNYIVRNQINSVPGAVAPVVFGGKSRQIMVYLQPNQLVGHNESPLDIVNALKSGNSMVPTGDVKIGDLDYSITSNGMVPNLKAFDELPVRVSHNASVLIRDVGQTVDASAVQTNVVQVNGVKETYLPLFRRVGSSTLDVVDNIKKAIPAVLDSLPPASELKLTFDQSPKVREAINDVIVELVIGVILAAIVIYFFLGSIIPTIVASIIIPLSILGGMLALYYGGQSLNIMTLGGLALITGPLIDKAIVVIENIERHIEEGRSVYESADRGATEVTLPVLMATLALIVVFYPVTFFEGLGKFLFTPMAFTVMITEILSYFAVMTMVPLLASKIFKSKKDHAAHAHGKGPNILVAKFNQGFLIVKEKYEVILKYGISNPQIVVSLTVSALLLSSTLLLFIGTEFFPITDNGQFFVRMRGKSGLRLEKMSELVEQVSKEIKETFPHYGVEMVLANTGVIQSWAAAYSPNSASHDAVLQVALKEGDSAASAIKILREKFAREYLDTSFSYSMIDPVASALNYGALSPLDLRLVSPSLEEGQKIANELKLKVSGVKGIKDAFVEQLLDYPAIHLDVDREKAAYLGFTADEVVKNVITALNSSVLFSQNFWDDPVSGNNYFIGAVYPEQQIDSLETIQNIPLIPRSGSVGSNESETITHSDSSTTLLRNVATLSMTKIPVEISHSNIKRVFDVMANVEGRDIGGVATEIDSIVKSLKLPRGCTIKWVGQVESMRQSFRSMGTGMILSLILIFLLLVAQLKSFIDPLLILATVPMGFIGVFWILFLTNTTFNIQSMMGMIMLIGIVVSNTVILTDFANARIIEGGISPRLAIQEAGVTRLRPILMTAISAFMALLPSSLSGANAPLARAVIGGLISSTFLTLVFLPALYVLVKERGSQKITVA